MIQHATDRLAAFTPPGCEMSMGIYTREQIEAMVAVVLNTEPLSDGAMEEKLIDALASAQKRADAAEARAAAAEAARDDARREIMALWEYIEAEGDWEAYNRKADDGGQDAAYRRWNAAWAALSPRPAVQERKS